MKKSPLSMPCDNGNNFHRGRGRRRGYGYNKQTRNDNVNFYRYSGTNNSPNNQMDANMIPLETSSPYHHQHHNNRGNWRQQNDRRNQRFSSTGISGSYNQRNNFQSSPGSPYSSHKHQRNQQHQNNYQQKNGSSWHRKLPISEYLDVRSVFENPWAELEKSVVQSKCQNLVKTVINDSSVEIILERNRYRDSLSESISDEATINISSSYDDIKEGSSVDLPLDHMNFSCDSKNTSALSDSVTSPTEKPHSACTNKSQEDSVVEIVY